jgi:hypothetical protein
LVLLKELSDFTTFDKKNPVLFLFHTLSAAEEKK